MKHTSLFIKIYLGFWLTIIVTAGAFFYLERIIITKPIINEWRNTLHKTVQFYADESVSIYNRGDVGELKVYFDRLEKATGIEAFLIDEKGRDVAGQAIPNEVADQLSERHIGHKPVYTRMKNAGIVSHKINIPGKPPYTFVARLPHSGPPPPPPPNMRSTGQQPPPDMAPPRPPLSGLFLPSPGLPPHILPPNFLIRMLIWLIVSAVICYLLARYLTSPIFKLGHAARQLAGGNLSVRVSPKLRGRRDEISSLASDFDGMAEQIEKLLTSQHNLLRDVSHELRSPLARLNVALELCRQNLSPEEEKHLDRIALETERLNELIGQILTYNRINMGAADLQKTKFDISPLIDEVAQDANYEARSSRVAIGVNELFFVEGNYDYLRRALENIIRNAIYHAPPDSLIEVSTAKILEKDKPMVRITVRDHGRGVPEDALPLLFKPFFKIASDSRHKTGAGLGLAISEAAIRFHGGEIKARNAEGGGLIIELTLPESTG